MCQTGGGIWHLIPQSVQGQGATWSEIVPAHCRMEWTKRDLVPSNQALLWSCVHLLRFQKDLLSAPPALTWYQNGTGNTRGVLLSTCWCKISWSWFSPSPGFWKRLNSGWRTPGSRVVGSKCGLKDLSSVSLLTSVWNWNWGWVDGFRLYLY